MAFLSLLRWASTECSRSSNSHHRNLWDFHTIEFSLGILETGQCKHVHDGKGYLITTMWAVMLEFKKKLVLMTIESGYQVLNAQVETATFG